MSEFNTQVQMIELTDEQLEAAQGGSFGEDVARLAYEHARNNSLPIRVLEWFAGGRGPLQ